MVRGKTKPLAIWRGVVVEPSNADDTEAYSYLEKCGLDFSETESIEDEPNDVDCDNRGELFHTVIVPAWNLYSRGE